MAHSATPVNARDSHGASALLWAARSGCTALVRLLLAHPDILPNAASLWCTTPLLTACEQGQRKMVPLLLDHPGLDINAADCRGRTPLMAVAVDGHRAIVRQLLLRRETASDLIDWAGLGAIDYAVRSGHYTIAGLIRQRGGLGGVAQLWAISYRPQDSPPKANRPRASFA
ncbi:MAG: ankyrin repeat domain-containing protein [Sodalis sp. (in: enterobacteria)]|uniref:ankyrin repeat domain-containing protein n=1 Tax=Sodalis sp. (in: enterobacteria) TaxID=1898979 RepID=UPI003F2D20B9